MPKGSYTLADVKADRIVIECQRCNRRGNFSTARLLEKYGPDIALPDLKLELVTCRISEAAGLDGCKSGYSEETRRSWLGN